MKLPLITATYVAILALLYAMLSLAIVRLRQRNRVAFGDGGNSDLRSAIRAHAHFAEYVPIIALMAAVLEMSGLPTIPIHMLMGALLIGRLLHPFGMYAGPQTLQFRVCRVGGHGDHHPCHDHLFTAHSDARWPVIRVLARAESAKGTHRGRRQPNVLLGSGTTQRQPVARIEASLPMDG
jgi:uncharacterized protein